jgi:hypothetical protein
MKWARSEWDLQMHGVTNLQLGCSGDSESAFREIYTTCFNVSWCFSLDDTDPYVLVKLKSRKTSLGDNMRVLHGSTWALCWRHPNSSLVTPA